MAGSDLRILVVGALGRMGERVRACIEHSPGLSLGAALEASEHAGMGSELAEGVVVSDDVKAALGRSDVAVVFAVPDPTVRFLEAASEAGIPAVVGTTGCSAEQHARIESAARHIPLVLAGNFSVAVNVLIHLTRRAAALLPEYQAEILELHHAHKIDAPSGTALALGSAIAEARGLELDKQAVLAREGQTGVRPDGAIGFQALRGGDVAGEHTVFFLGTGERVELSHRASTRDHFAAGALRAARWVHGREPGLYDMQQVLGLSDHAS